jgi:hypothetical protein
MNTLERDDWIIPCQNYTETKIAPFLIDFFNELLSTYDVQAKFIDHHSSLAEDIDYFAQNPSSSFGLFSVAFLYTGNDSPNIENLRKIYRLVRDSIYNY